MANTASHTRAERRERAEILWEVTRSLCPQCHRLLDAQVLLRENQVIQRKRCPEHGLFEAALAGPVARAGKLQRAARAGKAGRARPSAAGWPNWVP